MISSQEVDRIIRAVKQAERADDLVVYELFGIARQLHADLTRAHQRIHKLETALTDANKKLQEQAGGSDAIHP